MDVTLVGEQGLFLDEVLEARRGGWLGSVRIATPISHRLWTLAALLTCTLILIWLFSGHYTRRERVPGSLVPKAGLIELTATSPGRVTQVTAQEGTPVHRGDVLVALSGATVSARIGDTAEAVIAQLNVERTHLQGDIADAKTSSENKAQGLRVQRGELRMQLQQLDSQLAIQRQQVTSLRALLTKIEPLVSKGYVSQLQVQQQEMSALEAESQIKALSRERYQTEQQLSGIEDQVRQLPLDTQAKLSESSRQLAQVQQSLDQSEAQRSSVLRAPQDGMVSSVLVQSGQAVTAGQPVVAIVPYGTPLQAQLLVPSSAVGFVHVGQSVNLRYEAFPYQKFGLQRGRVLTVSRNALTPAEIQLLVGQTPQQSLYRVQVEIDKQAISAYGKPQALKPGMALDADIMMDRRRLVELAFEPLFGISKHFEGSP
jgi:membrane fusion protein